MTSKGITRIITGTILALICFAAFICGGLPLFVVVFAFVILGTKEYVQILKNKGFFPSFKIIVFADLLYAITAYFNRIDLIPFVVTVSCISAFMWVLFKGRQPYIANVATTILGFVYGGWLPLYFISLRDLGTQPVYYGLLKMSSLGDGLWFALMLSFCVLFTDTGCYVIGSKFGKHKLAPIVSPSKTIEGAIGGGICTIICALVIGYLIRIPWYHSLILGLLITIFAQIGDLCESLIKRDAGVKDSSDILPGHGGFLDRSDSYIFTIPVAYYYLSLFVSNGNVGAHLIETLKGLF